MENNYLNLFIKSESLLNFLKNIANRKLKQAYLFSSNDSLKNKYSCEVLALLLLCKNNNKPCLNCESCKKIINSNSVDLLVYPKNKTILVEDIEEIIDTCYIMPLENEYKIYILNDFDLANISSQNKFLKTLEEPPKNVIFLLNTAKPDMLLDTIKSRCEKINLINLTNEEFNIILKESGLEFNETAFDNCDNELGKYLKLIETNFVDCFNFCLDLLTNMNVSSDILTYAYKINKDKQNLENYFISLISIFKDLKLSKINLNLINNKKNKEKIIDISSKFNDKAIDGILKNLIVLNKELNYNTNETLIIDCLLLNILEEKYKWN